MANEEHFNILKQGVDVWNNWRRQQSRIEPDLSGINLNNAYLHQADFSKTNLSGANLKGSFLALAKFHQANLHRAVLSRACLQVAVFYDTNLSEADLTNTDLSAAIFIDSNLERANLTGCGIYGISVWNVKLTDTIQSNLIISPPSKPTSPPLPSITVDNIQVAQFIYLLLDNAAVRNVIDTITSKAVLILGRFTVERKHVLDALRDELRKRNYLPILFDGAGPDSRDFTETVRILAGMARFVIADISSPRSIPQELQAIVPNYLSVAVQPIIIEGETPYGTFRDIQRYPNVVDLYTYENEEHLLQTLVEKVIVPAEERVKQLRPPNNRI